MNNYLISVYIHVSGSKLRILDSFAGSSSVMVTGEWMPDNLSFNVVEVSRNLIYSVYAPKTSKLFKACTCYHRSIFENIIIIWCANPIIYSARNWSRGDEISLQTVICCSNLIKTSISSDTPLMVSQTKWLSYLINLEDMSWMWRRLIACCQRARFNFPFVGNIDLKVYLFFILPGDTARYMPSSNMYAVI